MAEHKPIRASGAPTIIPLPRPVVLVVGGPDELTAAAQRVIEGDNGGIEVHECAPAETATAVSTLRPFAIVVGEDLFTFDPAEFEALARDVGALLVHLKVSGVQSTFLEQALRPSLRTAYRNWRTHVESGPVHR